MNQFRRSSLNIALLLVISSASNASGNERPSIDRLVEVALWPENSKVLQDGIRELDGKKWAITRPTYIVYLPIAGSKRPAVIVFPGGGYKALAIGSKSTIGLNGTDVCKWLTESGVACILLKYRVPDTGCHWNQQAQRNEAPNIPMALQDAQRAISMIRYKADEYGIDQNKIGVMGFSAGGNLAVLSSTAFKSRSYEAFDEIDRVSSRPDFAVPVYPGHMTMEHKNKLPKAIAAQELNTDIVISAEIPPTLLIHAKDDPIDPVRYSMVYERELRNAGVNVKLIIYENGGHAFGVKKQGKDTDRWTINAIDWLMDIGIL